MRRTVRPGAQQSNNPPVLPPIGCTHPTGIDDNLRPAGAVRLEQLVVPGRQAREESRIRDRRPGRPRQHPHVRVGVRLVNRVDLDLESFPLRR